MFTFVFVARFSHFLLEINSPRALVLPKSEPRIESADGEVSDAALPTNYKPGDTLLLVCESPPSYPEPTLRWTINGKSVGAKVAPASYNFVCLMPFYVADWSTLTVSFQLGYFSSITASTVIDH